MLDLARLATQIDEMIKESKDNIIKNTDLIEHALNLVKEYDNDPASFLLKIDSDERHFFVAFPQGKLSKVFPLPPSMPTHSVVAVDASQIEIDTHEVVLCFVLNAGRIVIHYGAGDIPILENQSKLFFKEEDLYVQGQYEKQLIQGETLAEIRQKFEASHLADLLLKHHKEDTPTVALVDGRLVTWDRSGDFRKDPAAFRAPHFEDLFCTTSKLNIPVAGYVSGSRTSLVANTLRAKSCVKSAMRCSDCEFRRDKSAMCNYIAGVRDTSLFKNLLNLGERSCNFYGGINSISQNEVPKYRIGFFYINVGSEIARVEAPDYVLENPQLTNMLHRIVFDQAQKGMGYPITLQEAHNFAVIKSEDRERFFNILKKQLAKHGFEIKVTSKKIGKMTRIF